MNIVRYSLLLYLLTIYHTCTLNYFTVQNPFATVVINTSSGTYHHKIKYNIILVLNLVVPF